MALLQINEPSLSAAPYQRRLAAGIGLGAANSLVATVRSGQTEALADHEGRHLPPPVVHYQQQGCSVGCDTRANAALDTANTVSLVKYMIGHSLADIQARYPYLPCTFQTSGNDLSIIEAVAGLLDPVHVPANILKALAMRATESLSGELDDVVITVPAYFDDVQRQGTEDAVCLADLHVLRLLNEPTTAMIAYGLGSGQEGVVAVHGFGGGIFDISILCLSRDVFEVLMTGDDSAPGGDDFDHLLADYIREQAGVADRNDNRVQRELLDTIIAAKIALSDADPVMVNVAGWQSKITRKTSNELISALAKRMLLTCHCALKNAGVEPQDVLEVVMVGGSTYTPLVRGRADKFFGRTPLTSIDPNRMVAISAVTQAGILAGDKSDSEMLLLDVIPLPPGLEAMGDLVEKMIPRSTIIPMARAQDFTTFRDDQTAMSVHVMQGERELAQDCCSPAHFASRDIPALSTDDVRIRATLQVDADGLLSVTVIEKSTGIESSIQVKPSYGPTDSEIVFIIQDSMSFAGQGVKARMLAEQKAETTRALESLSGALNADTALLSTVERQAIDTAVTYLSKVAQGDDVNTMEQAIKNVDKQTQELVARRMGKSTHSALKGRSVGET